MLRFLVTLGNRKQAHRLLISPVNGPLYSASTHRYKIQILWPVAPANLACLAQLNGLSRPARPAPRILLISPLILHEGSAIRCSLTPGVLPSPKHASEFLLRVHGLSLSYSWTSSHPRPQTPYMRLRCGLSRLPSSFHDLYPLTTPTVQGLFIGTSYQFLDSNVLCQCDSSSYPFSPYLIPSFVVFRHSPSLNSSGLQLSFLNNISFKTPRNDAYLADT